MLDIGWSEMAVILIVALIVVGPKDLPRLARTLGKWAAKGRSMAYEFQRSMDQMAREAELDDIKRDLEKVSKVSKFDVRKTIADTIDPDGTIKQAIKPPRLDLDPPKPPAPVSAEPAPASAATAQAAASPTPAAAPAVASASAQATIEPSVTAAPLAGGDRT